MAENGIKVTKELQNGERLVKKNLLCDNGIALKSCCSCTESSENCCVHKIIILRFALDQCRPVFGSIQGSTSSIDAGLHNIKYVKRKGTIMTTMNLPAQYNLIAEEEMTYVTGGSAWEDFQNVMYLGYYIFLGPVNLFSAISYYKDAANNIADIGSATTLLGEIAAIGKAVANFGYGTYYLGNAAQRPNSAKSYWNKLVA